MRDPLAHFLDLFFGHNLGINETDNRHSINIFQAEETARALRHRETPVGDGNRTIFKVTEANRPVPHASLSGSARHALKNPSRPETCVTNTFSKKRQGIKGSPTKDRAAPSERARATPNRPRDDGQAT